MDKRKPEIIKIYLAGSLPKGKEEEETFVNWKHRYKSVLQTTSTHIDFLDPEDDRPSEGDAKGVFGKDCFQIKNCDLVLVNAEHPLGPGTSMECLIAKYFAKPVLLILPIDSPHRKSRLLFEEEVVEDWKHPFLVSSADYIFESVEECAHQNFEELCSKEAKTLSIIDEALAYFEKIKKI
ncbi:hypothetical protein H6501_04610 [Candidatus Woesearchaeota archaeon]|nr:hypothetical protein [Nanoarchaeota archaeon]MCB9370854.1 hypothetical protein [Candidatus Woesearchaeota archaeon]USN43955.1 MAG: hypothetical protein H6500_06215 [Candidatus Woesearchaeota archaeon]